MSLLRTPVGVTTRQQEKRKQRMMTSQDDDKKELELPVQPESIKMCGSQATRSSSSAARKRLELQAARRKAEIEMKALELKAHTELAVKKAHIEVDLVNKELEAELADLELRRISHRSLASSRSKVEDWLDKSLNNVEKTGERECEQAGDVTRDIVNPVRNSDVSQRNDIRELATALKEAITLSAPKSNNQELLTRLATSKDLPIIHYSDTVNIWRLRKDDEEFKLRAREIKELNLPVQCLSNIDFKKCEHLDHNYELCKCDIQPELLIGQDNYDFIAPILCIRGQPGEPYVTKTSEIKDKVTYSNLLSDRSNTHVCFAQCVPTLIDSSYRPCRTIVNPVAGSVPELPAARAIAECATSEGGTSRVLTAAAAQAAQPMSSTYSERFDCSTNADYDLLKLHELVRQSFSLDSIGISQKPRKNRDELRATETPNNTSELIGSQWTVGLPRKSDNTVMPDSYTNASRRLQSVLRKTAASEVYESRYQERVDHLFIKNYARPVNDAETGKRVWYLPHFGVDNPNKKKLRLVFDAAAKISWLFA